VLTESVFTQNSSEKVDGIILGPGISIPTNPPGSLKTRDLKATKDNEKSHYINILHFGKWIRQDILRYLV